MEEKEQFDAIRSRLIALLENQITHFRYVTPSHLRPTEVYLFLKIYFFQLKLESVKSYMVMKFLN